MRKTYVLKQSHIQDFKKTLLEDQSYSFGTSVRNFDFSFNEGILDTHSLQIDVYTAFQLLELNILKDIVKYPKTTIDIINLTTELNLYGIGLENLPKKTALHQEIFKLVTCADSIVPKPSVPNHDVEAYLEGLSHAEVSYIKNNNILSHDFTGVEPEMVRFRSALNIRSEIESCIQDILNQDFENVVVAIPNLRSHTSLITSILSRYGIVADLQSKRVIDAYLSTVDYLLDPTLVRFKAMLLFNPLNLRYPGDLVEYINITDLSHDTLLDPFNHFQETDLFKDHLNLQTRIQDDVLIFQEWLRNTSNLSYSDIISQAYTTLLEYTSLPLQSLKSFLEKNHTLYTEQTHLLFLEHIRSLESSQTIGGPIRWVDISDIPFGHLENLYVLNLSAQNYPTVSKRTGIVDASYLGEIIGFPSLDKRTQFELHQSSVIFNKSSRLTLSYANANYEGKGYEVSFVVDTYCKERSITLKPWPLHELQSKPKIKHALSPDIASQIYRRRGIIKGSISSFQNFIQDPYKFFIERGLGVQEPLGYEFSPMIMGTLNHSIMQHLGEDYNPWLNVGKVFPLDTPKYTMIRKRNTALMALNTQHIQEALADTDFSIKDKELYFEEDTMFPGIHLRGIIDRVDINSQAIMIIDYKSSSESLSESSVKAMKQLQLLTYARIANKRYSLPVLGVFNYAFRTSNILQSYAQYSLSKGLEISEPSLHSEWLNKKRFTGWFFENPTDHIDSDTYFTNLYVNKDGLALRGAPYDIEKISDLLDHNYETIQKLIYQGVLDSDDITIEIDDDLSLKKDGETA